MRIKKGKYKQESEEKDMISSFEYASLYLIGRCLHLQGDYYCCYYYQCRATKEQMLLDLSEDSSFVQINQKKKQEKEQT